MTRNRLEPSRVCGIWPDKIDAGTVQESKLSWWPKHTDFVAVLKEYSAQLHQVEEDAQTSAMPAALNLSHILELWACIAMVFVAG